MGEVPEPEVVVGEDEYCVEQKLAGSHRACFRTTWGFLTAGCEEQRVSQLDIGEPPHVAEVYDVREDAQECEEDGKSVDDT